MNDYDRLLDQAVKVGVNHISPMMSSFSKQEEYYQLALAKAVKNAQEKASLPAGSYTRSSPSDCNGGIDGPIIRSDFYNMLHQFLV